MIVRTIVFFSVVFAAASVGLTAKTIVETDWKELSYCDGEFANDGGDRARIRLTRKFDDGTYQVKFIWKLCADPCECWHHGEWGDIASYPTDGLPAFVDNNNHWHLQSVPLGKGGSFVAGSGGTWNFLPSIFLSEIFVPAAIAS